MCKVTRNLPFKIPHLGKLPQDVCSLERGINQERGRNTRTRPWWWRVGPGDSAWHAQRVRWEKVRSFKKASGGCNQKNGCRVGTVERRTRKLGSLGSELVVSTQKTKQGKTVVNSREGRVCLKGKEIMVNPMTQPWVMVDVWDRYTDKMCNHIFFFKLKEL